MKKIVMLQILEILSGFIAFFLICFAEYPYDLAFALLFTVLITIFCFIESKLRKGMRNTKNKSGGSKKDNVR